MSGDGAIVRVIEICNKKGLHARASAKFVKCAEAYSAEVRVSSDGQTVGGTSIMGLMMLAAGPGTTILIEADGDDADAVLKALSALVEDGFGEECVDCVLERPDVGPPRLDQPHQLALVGRRTGLLERREDRIPPVPLPPGPAMVFSF